MAEPALHHLVQVARTRRDVAVDDQPFQAVSLDRDRPVALLLDELTEEVVSQLKKDFLAVGGLTQREQTWPARQQPHDGIGVDGVSGVNERRSHTFDGIVESPIET